VTIVTVCKRTLIPLLLAGVIVGSTLTIWSPYRAFATSHIPSYYPDAVDTEQNPNFVLKSTIEISASYNEAQQRVPPVRVSIPETTGGGSAYLAITQATFFNPRTGQNVPHTRVGDPIWLRCPIENIRTGAFGGSPVMEGNNQADYTPGWANFDPARELGDRPLPGGGLESYWKADDFYVWCHGPGSFQEIDAILYSFTGVITVYDWFATPPADLSVTSVSAVQAPFDPDFLVYGKPTLIKARVSNTFDDTKTVAVKINADTPYEKIIPELALQPGTHDYFLPTEEYITPTTGSSLKPSVEVDTFNVITTEASEGNNIKVGQEYQVKETKDLKILYVLLRVAGDLVADPDCEDVDQVMRASERYLEAVFPVNPARVTHTLDCDFPTIDVGPLRDPGSALPPMSDFQLSAVYKTLQEMAWGKGVDHVVGVTRHGFFDELLNQGTTVGQTLFPQNDHPWSSLIVEAAGCLVPSEATGDDCTVPGRVSGAVTAHEIAHTYGIDHVKVTAPGYWVTERVPTSEFPNGEFTMDFMDNKTDEENLADIGEWVSKFIFDTLLSDLKLPGPDPAVIGVGGIISKDQSTPTLMDPLQSFNDILDLPLNNPGQYDLVYQSASGSVLAQTSFNLDFMLSDPEGTELSASPFAVRIPAVEGTEKIVLKHGDQVLAESTFGGDVDTTNNPPVAAGDTATTD
jgi:hypothetical protein